MFLFLAQKRLPKQSSIDVIDGLRPILRLGQIRVATETLLRWCAAIGARSSTIDERHSLAFQEYSLVASGEDAGNDALIVRPLFFRGPTGR